MTVAHLKHVGPIRAARAAKRTAQVVIYSDEAPANDPLTEADRALAESFAGPPFTFKTVAQIDAEVREELREEFYQRADAAREARKDADCASFGQREADRAQRDELRRMPGKGYLA